MIFLADRSFRDFVGILECLVLDGDGDKAADAGVALHHSTSVAPSRPPHFPRVSPNANEPFPFFVSRFRIILQMIPAMLWPDSRTRWYPDFIGCRKICTRSPSQCWFRSNKVNLGKKKSACKIQVKLSETPFKKVSKLWNGVGPSGSSKNE